MGNTQADPNRITQTFPQLYADGRGQTDLAISNFSSIVEKQINWNTNYRKQTRGHNNHHSDQINDDLKYPEDITTIKNGKHSRKKSSKSSRNNKDIEPCSQDDIRFMTEKFFCIHPYRPQQRDFMKGIHCKNWIYVTYYLYDIFAEYCPFKMHYSIQNEWIMEIFICSSFLSKEMDLYCCQLMDIMIKCWGIKNLTKYKFTDNTNNKNKNKLYHLIEFKSFALLNHCLNTKSYLKSFKTTAKNNKIYIYKIIENIQLNPNKNRGLLAMELIKWFMNKKRFITSNEFNNTKYKLTYIDLIRIVILRILKLKKRQKEFNKYQSDFDDNNHDQNDEEQRANYEKKIEIGILELNILLTQIKKYVIENRIMETPEYNEIIHHEIILLSNNRGLNVNNSNNTKNKKLLTEYEVLEFIKIIIEIRPNCLFYFSSLQNGCQTPLDLAKKHNLRKVAHFLDISMNENKHILTEQENKNLNNNNNNHKNQHLLDIDEIMDESSDLILSSGDNEEESDDETSEYVQTNNELYINNTNTNSSSFDPQQKQRIQQQYKINQINANHNINNNKNTLSRNVNRNSMNVNSINLNNKQNQNNTTTKTRTKSKSTKIIVKETKNQYRTGSHGHNNINHPNINKNAKSHNIDRKSAKYHTRKSMNNANIEKKYSRNSHNSKLNQKRKDDIFNENKYRRIKYKNKSEANTDYDNIDNDRDTDFSDNSYEPPQKPRRLKRENSTPNTRTKKKLRKKQTRSKGRKGTHDHSKSVALIDSEYYNLSDSGTRNVINTSNTSLTKKRKTTTKLLSKIDHNSFYSNNMINNNHLKNHHTSNIHTANYNNHYKRNKSYKYKKRQSTKTPATHSHRNNVKSTRSHHRRTATAAYIDDSDNDYIQRPIYHSRGPTRHDIENGGKYDPQPPALPPMNPVIKHGASADLIHSFNNEEEHDTSATNTLTQTYNSPNGKPLKHSFEDIDHHEQIRPIKNPYYVVDEDDIIIHEEHKRNKTMEYSPSGTMRRHKESDFHSNDDIVIITKGNSQHAKSPIFLSQRHQDGVNTRNGLRGHNVVLPSIGSANGRNNNNRDPHLPLNTVDDYMLSHPPNTTYGNHKQTYHPMDGIRSREHRDTMDSILDSPLNGKRDRDRNKGMSIRKQNEMESRIEILENENIVLKSDVRKLKRAVRELTNTVQQIMQTLQQQ